ncbi:hypothetical protein B0H14DRAFT_2594702 [Mycena olivaceomarginata]|nr:hypothetical protein B0H14DRAFT_2594702 [Mycena olivaceomarginata]
MSPASFSFSLAWDEDEGDIEAAGPGDAEFITTLNPNAHISLLKRIHIPKTQLRRVMADVGGIVKCAVPFQVDHLDQHHAKPFAFDSTIQGNHGQTMRNKPTTHTSPSDVTATLIISLAKRTSARMLSKITSGYFAASLG